jgi:aspartate kinase
MMVLKFGGTSLESAEALERVADIVRGRLPRRPVLVVSALGHATDNLLAMGSDAVAGRWHRALKQFRTVQEYHSDIAAALARKEDRRELGDWLDSHFVELHDLLESVSGSGTLSPEAQAAITSFGERLSSGMVATCLRKFGLSTQYFDSRKLIRTVGPCTESVPVLHETYANLRHALSPVPKGTVPVLGGFIGSASNGLTTTLGRNSSNLTAVLVAAALDAEEVEMWTDVDGVYWHDPSLVGDQSPVEELSFEEALALASNGARVLHLGAVQLAQQKDVPLRIKNSRKPSAPGTRIRSSLVAARACEPLTCSAD